MERPQKRLRLGQSPFDDGDEDEDELCQDPALLEAKQDPNYELNKSRAKAAFRLKSTFEDIFEKYGKDFTGVGDEIDLRTGEVVVDNGHLHSMKDGRDVGAATPARAASVSDSSDDEAKILHGSAGNIRGWEVGAYQGAATTLWRPMPSVFEPPSRLSQLFVEPRLTMPTPYTSFPSFGGPSGFLDQTWAAPELPPSAFHHGFESRLGGLFGRGMPRRSHARMLLPSVDLEPEEEDEILLGPVTHGPSPVSRSGGGGGKYEQAAGRYKHSKKDVCDGTSKHGHGRKNSKEANETPEQGKKSKISGNASDQRRNRQNRKSGETRNKVLVVKHRRRRISATEASRQHLDKSHQSLLVAKDCFDLDQGSEVLPWKTKPGNQTLIVAIRARVDLPGAMHKGKTASSPKQTAPKIIAMPPTSLLRACTPTRIDIVPDSQNPSPTLSAAPFIRSPAARQPETFTRNVVDPAYTFSDEDEPRPAARRQAPIPATPRIELTTPDPTVLLTSPDLGHEITLEQGKDAQNSASHSSTKRSGNVRHTYGGSSARKRQIESRKDSQAAKPAQTRDKPASKKRRRRTATVAGQPEEGEVSKATTGRFSSASKTSNSALPSVAAVAVPEKRVASASASGQRTPPATPDRADKLKGGASSATGLPSSGKNTTILSLVSDDEEDELSFHLATSSPSGPYSGGVSYSKDHSNSKKNKKSSRQSWSSIARATAKKKTTTMLLLSSTSANGKAINSTTTPSGDGLKAKKSSTLHRSWRSSGVGDLNAGAASPTESLVRTPGGTVRRCGENGFKCERDFCFTCL